MKLTRFSTCCVMVLAFAVVMQARAEDVFYSVKIDALTITEGQWSEKWKNVNEGYNYMPVAPSLVLDGEGEIYFKLKDDQGGVTSPLSWHKRSEFKSSAKIAVRVSEKRDVTGRLIVPGVDKKSFTSLRFSIPKDSPSGKDAEKEFFEARVAHYQRQIDMNVPGTAWFRHQRDEVDSKYRVSEAGGRPRRNRDRGTFEQETFDLFTGGRAISENLQLDRDMLERKGGADTVAVDSLKGITVQEMDWKALIKDAAPKTDPLAAAIPADQHALFFPSFQAMVELSDEADAHGTPVLQLLEPRAEDARTSERLHKQLCLEVSQFSRVMGPAFIGSVAFTGSDPYLRSGSDVAVLFEAKSVTSLTAFIATKYAAALAGDPQAKEVKSEIAGVPYSGVVTPNRTLSSYMAVSGDVVVVSNSTYQLGRVLAAIKGTTPSMQSLPEYSFFRMRYARGDKDETGLLIMTDAAIRRWCSPRWRIGNARRTYAAAALAELQARNMDALAKGTVKEGSIDSEFKGLGEVVLTRSGVRSSIYNTLEFQTPISELDLAQVTTAEADAYKTWRDGYQQNWRAYFDPIAVRTGVSNERLSADVTVMPLIAGTEYREIIELVKDAKIEPHAVDRHKDELLNLNVALNPKYPMLEWIAAGQEAKLVHWVGQTVTFYQDDAPIWKDLLLLAASDTEKFWKERGWRLPVVASVSVRHEAIAKRFLDQLLEQANENGRRLWEEQEYNGHKYFRVRFVTGIEQTEPIVYCGLLPDVLLASLDESTFKRAIDRHDARKAKPDKAAPDATPVLGEQLGLHIEKKFLDVLQRSAREKHVELLQQLSWGNLPILNEWKRLFPQSDPVAMHEKLWGTKLLCPGGGKYVWNEQFARMESSVFGHPADPKMPSSDNLPTPLARVRSGNFGLTFENQGLRAKVVIERSAK